VVKPIHFLVKLNPSYFAFLGGIFVSICINLLTDLVFGNPDNAKMVFEWLVTATFFIASIAYIGLSTVLDKPYRHWVVYWRDAVNHYDLKELEIIRGAIGEKKNIILSEFVLGVTATILGIALMIYSGFIN
jgi:hypothetical protein